MWGVSAIVGAPTAAGNNPSTSATREDERYYRLVDGNTVQLVDNDIRK
jgi:hypothetical protein